MILAGRKYYCSCWGVKAVCTYNCYETLRKPTIPEAIISIRLKQGLPYLRLEVKRLQLNENCSLSNVYTNNK